MARYTWFAPLYDALSAEQVYRAGRRCAVSALDLQPGDRVLDIGCGTGLNFPLLLEAVGPTGRVVGVDASEHMLQAARVKLDSSSVRNVALVQADAQTLDRSVLASAGAPECAGEGEQAAYDAVLFTYALSLMDDPSAAWCNGSALVRAGGKAAVVDMEPPHGPPNSWVRLLSPLARLACLLGGADINARPWTDLEETATGVRSWSLRGGHVQVRVGRL